MLDSQARDEIDLLEGILERHAVDHGGQHAHVVRMSPCHALHGVLYPPKDVAAPDDDGHFGPGLDGGLDLVRVGAENGLVDPKLPVPQQGLAAELQQHTLVVKG